MKIPSFVWIILVLVIGFGFVALLANNKNNATIANATLPVKVDVYVDFNCPHCAEFEPTVAQMREKYGDQADIQLKMLPFLTSGQNPDTSVEYALAALAVKKEAPEKFNDFSQSIFKWITYKKSPTNTVFTYTDAEKTMFAGSIDMEALAKSYGLDAATFNKDRTSDEIKAEMKSEKDTAVAGLGAPSTPAVFMYGKLFKMNTYDQFDTKIQEYINQAKANESK